MNTEISTQPPYSFAFTAASLRLNDLKALVEAERSGTTTSQSLGFKTESSGKRVRQELQKRAHQLSDKQADLLLHGMSEEQQHLAFWAACKTYPLLFDFVRDVVREKFMVNDTHLHYGDFQAFAHRQAAYHPQLERVSETTFRKGRQIVFRMLEEAGLIAGKRMHKIIQPQLYSLRFLEAIAPDPPQWRFCLLLDDDRLQSLTP